MGKSTGKRWYIKEEDSKTLISKNWSWKNFTEHSNTYLLKAVSEFDCCETSITYVCRKLKITRKKATCYREQEAEKAAEYEAAVKEIAIDKLFYSDKAGFDSYLLQMHLKTNKWKWIS